MAYAIDRLYDWQMGKWNYVGIIITAYETVYSKIDPTLSTKLKLSSSSLWGIESGTSKEYIDEIKADLASELAYLLGKDLDITYILNNLIVKDDYLTYDSKPFADTDEIPPLPDFPDAPNLHAEYIYSPNSTNSTNVGLKITCNLCGREYDEIGYANYCYKNCKKVCKL